jgi:hypothetical protein
MGGALNAQKIWQLSRSKLLVFSLKGEAEEVLPLDLFKLLFSNEEK